MTLKEQIEKYNPIDEIEEKDKEGMLKYIDTFNDILFRTNEFAHFSSSAWIVNSDMTKVLMVYHNIYNEWSWTGGHCDGDANLLEVAIREAKEETGIQNLKPLSNNMFSIEILTVEGHVKNGERVAPHLHLNTTFLFQADEEEPLKIKEDENKGVEWFKTEDIFKERIDFKMQEIYRKLIKKCKMNMESEFYGAKS